MKLHKNLYRTIIIALILLLFFPCFVNATNPPVTTSSMTEEEKDATVVMLVKRAVAMWYYILRNVVILIMLILLIFIGIKMAISTIASEKATYKKMLWDWLVGMIVVFSIHYVILFIINFNELLVGIISGDINTTIKVERIFSTTEDQKSNVELEMTMYDEVKTRAYDPKLTNGVTGTILYMFLVYYAFKYTFIYLKRYLIVIVLTLMSPVVAGSYALNKVLTGKSKIFSTWLTEFIMNVLIQSVHAFIYAAFISLALRLSIINIAGMILTLILLNFMSKAEALFRRIFKMSEGGSITGNLMDKSDPVQHAKEKINKASNLLIGGGIAKTALKSSARLVSKPFRTAGNAVFGGAMLLAGKVQDRTSTKKAEQQRLLDKKKAGEAMTLKEHQMFNKLEEKRRRQEEKEKEAKAKRYRRSSKTGQRSNTKEGTESQTDKKGKKQKTENLNIGIDSSFLAMFNRTKNRIVAALDPNLYTEMVRKEGKGGKVRYKRRIIKTKRETKNNYAKAVRNKETGEIEYKSTEKKRFFGPKTDSVGMRLLSNLKEDLSIDPDDEEEKKRREREKKAIQQHKALVKSTVKGFAGIMVGIPMAIDSPSLGVAALSYGVANAVDVLSEFNKPSPYTRKNESINRKIAQLKALSNAKNVKESKNDKEKLAANIVSRKAAGRFKRAHSQLANNMVVQNTAERAPGVYEAMTGNSEFTAGQISIGGKLFSGIKWTLHNSRPSVNAGRGMRLAKRNSRGGLIKRYNKGIGSRVYLKERLAALNAYEKELDAMIEELEAEGDELTIGLINSETAEVADLRLIQQMIGMNRFLGFNEIIEASEGVDEKVFSVNEVQNKLVQNLLFGEVQAGDVATNELREILKESLILNLKGELVENILLGSNQGTAPKLLNDDEFRGKMQEVLADKLLFGKILGDTLNNPVSEEIREGLIEYIQLNDTFSEERKEKLIEVMSDKEKKIEELKEEDRKEIEILLVEYTLNNPEEEKRDRYVELVEETIIREILSDKELKDKLKETWILKETINEVLNTQEGKELIEKIVIEEISTNKNNINEDALRDAINESLETVIEDIAKGDILDTEVKEEAVDKLIEAIFISQAVKEEDKKEEVVVVTNKKEETPEVVIEQRTGKVEIKNEDKLIDDAISDIAKKTGIDIIELSLNGSTMSDIKRQIEELLKRSGVEIDDRIMDLINNLDSRILNRKSMLDKKSVVAQSTAETLHEQQKTLKEVQKSDEKEQKAFAKTVQEKSENKLVEIVAKEVLRKEIEQNREKYIQEKVKVEGVEREVVEKRLLSVEESIERKFDEVMGEAIKKVAQTKKESSEFKGKTDEAKAIKEVTENEAKKVYYEKIKEIANKGESENRSQSQKVAEELKRKIAEEIGNRYVDDVAEPESVFEPQKPSFRKPEVTEKNVMDTIGKMRTTVEQAEFKQKREETRKQVHESFINDLKKAKENHSVEEVTYESPLLKSIVEQTCTVSEETVPVELNKKKKEKNRKAMEIVDTGDSVFRDSVNVNTISNMLINGDRIQTGTGDKKYDPERIKKLESAINKFNKKY